MISSPAPNASRIYRSEAKNFKSVEREDEEIKPVVNFADQTGKMKQC